MTTHSRRLYACVVIAWLAWAAAATAQAPAGDGPGSVVYFEPPVYAGAPAGLPLAPTDGWYIPPVTGSIGYNVHTYAGNTLGFPNNPGGGEQFAGGVSAGGTAFARAQRDLAYSAAEWEMASDVCVGYLGVLPATQNIGSMSFQPSTTSAACIALARWTVPATAANWNADMTWYNAGGAELIEALPNPGFQGLLVRHWYRWRVVVDFVTNRILEVSITDLSTSVTVTYNPTDRYLRGGSAGGLPLPTGNRLFSGGTTAGNAMGWDNFVVRPLVPPVVVCQTCLGDMDGNNFVNGDDMQRFIACLLGAATPTECPCADMNGDEVLNFLDVPQFVARLLSDQTECRPDLEVAPPLPGAGPDRVGFNVEVELGPPFNDTASGEGTLALLTDGNLAFNDILWESGGTAQIPAFSVHVPGLTPIAITPTGTEWTLNGVIDVLGDPGPQEPDAIVRVSMIGPPPAMLIEPGSRYELNPLLPSVAVVQDPTAFGGLPAGTQIPIQQHPVKIKKYCVYRIVASGPNPPIGNCPPGWAAGAILCVECDRRQKQQCPPSGIYRVVGRNCVLDLRLQPPGTCGPCPAGGVDNARFFGWRHFPKPRP